jgi:hypothetical protein
MFYVKLKEDGTLERYPYTLTDLRRSNKDVSFPKQISDETAAQFNCFPVTPTEPPADNYTVNVERTAIKEGNEWVERWIQTPATAQQIAERTAAKAYDVRNDRNKRLADCDWTQLADSPVDKTVWETYRQALRDVPSQKEFPWVVAWPDEPK